MKAKILGTLLAIGVCGLANAQTVEPSITLTAAATSGVGQVTPVLTWSTVPAATGCVGSGGWSGNKGASGTESLPAITTSATYNLTCTWSTGSGTSNRVTLRWTPPTKNTDGTDYTDPKEQLLYFSTNSSQLLTQRAPVKYGPTETTSIIGPLTAGTWFFGVQAVNQAGVASDMSNVASKNVTAVSTTTAERSLGITIISKPAASSDLSVE